MLRHSTKNIGKRSADVDFINIPKAELHVHLDGSVRPATILDLAGEQNIQLGVDDEQALRSILQPPADQPSLPRYLEAFDTICAVLGTEDALERVAFEFLEDHARAGVRYVEVRYSTRVLPNTIKPDDAIRAVWKGLQRGMEQHNIVARQIIALMKHEPPNVGEEVAELAVAMQEYGVVGFDAAGPERQFPPELFCRAYRIATDGGLGLTMHAGEDGPADYVRQAIDELGATRIGHATHLVDDLDLLRRVAAANIHVEACPTSNVQTGAVGTYEAHPLPVFLDEGVNTTLCTDNTTVSSVSSDEEYARAAESFGLELAQLRRLSLDGFRASFAEPALRERLVTEAEAAWDTIKPQSM